MDVSNHTIQQNSREVTTIAQLLSHNRTMQLVNWKRCATQPTVICTDCNKVSRLEAKVIVIGGKSVKSIDAKANGDITT